MTGVISPGYCENYGHFHAKTMDRSGQWVKYLHDLTMISKHLNGQHCTRKNSILVHCKCLLFILWKMILNLWKVKWKEVIFKNFLNTQVNKSWEFCYWCTFHNFLALPLASQYFLPHWIKLYPPCLLFQMDYWQTPFPLYSRAATAADWMVLTDGSQVISASSTSILYFGRPGRESPSLSHHFS